MNRILNPIYLALTMLILSGCDLADPREDASGVGVEASDNTVSFFNRFQAFTAGPDDSYGYDRVGLESLVIEFINNAELSVDAAFENFDSVLIAEALNAAHRRGVTVRIVADIDRRHQSGFQFIDGQSEIEAVYGDGEILWQAVFGADNVVRSGEDNRMMHNFVIVDDLRMINLTTGFPPIEGPQAQPNAVQVGFIAHSEDLTKDFGDVFDQLHGGVFSTRLTFYDDTVSSDTNNRTFYPLRDGVIEAYFGPQEPLVKEIIDQIYAARSSVYIASSEFRNGEIARALRYKAEAGFDVRVVVAQALNQREESGALIEWFADRDNAFVRRHPNIAQTMIVIDGRTSHLGGGHQPGRVMVSSMPIFEAAGYYVQSEVGGGSPVLAAQPSGLFTDTNMWVIHEGRNNAAGLDYLQFEQQFDRFFAEGVQ